MMVRSPTATQREFALPALPYDFSALEPLLDARTVELHYTQHHSGYVDGANRALDHLASARAECDHRWINQLERDLAFYESGHVLHSLFWESMTPDLSDGIGFELAAAIERTFGGVDHMRLQFMAAGLRVRGSGWASLSWDPLTRALAIIQIYDHQDNALHAAVPLLVADMWEHAYYLRYQNRRAEWLEAFWLMIDWSKVESRYDAASRADPLPPSFLEQILAPSKGTVGP